jgi:membrane protein implicated in regulation of membrane protease activity
VLFNLSDSFLAITETGFLFTPPWFWLLTGILLIVGDLLLLRKLPSNFRFIPLSMGVAALFVALVLWRAGIFFGVTWKYIMYDRFENQIFYWMGVALAFVIWLRPILIQRKKFVIQASQEGTTLTEILPGKTGRVLYEGSSWQAKCSDAEASINSDQKVYILGREGNTLIIASEDLFKA